MFDLSHKKIKIRVNLRKSLAFFLFFFWSGFIFAAKSPEATSREIAVSRYSVNVPGLLDRSYDLPGQKSEWLLGTSILGSPEFSFELFALASLTMRYPTKLAGLYAPKPVLDIHTLSLNGENAVLYVPRRSLPIDTPITDIAWERFAFEGNSLKLQFSRLLTDSIQLDLGVASFSNRFTKEFLYQDVTHQPFFSMGRDSSSIPFSGKNMAMNSIHLQPSLRYFLPNAELAFHTQFLFLDNSDATLHIVKADSIDKTSLVYLEDPYLVSIRAQSYALESKWKASSKLKLQNILGFGFHQVHYDSLPPLEKPLSIFEASDSLILEQNLDYQTIVNHSMLSYQTLLNPALVYNFEFYNLSDLKKTHYQDRALGYLQVQDTLGFASFNAQLGLQRNSSYLNTVDFAKTYSWQLYLDLPFHLQASLSRKHSTQFPDINQLNIINRARYEFPNKNLIGEKRTRDMLSLEWDREVLFYGLNFYRENLENAIRPRWITNGGLDSVARAFQWVNLANNIIQWSWSFSTGFHVKNWKFYIERGELLSRNIRLMDAQDLYYKASVFWSNRFVSERLGVSVRFDLQWFDRRLDAGINEDYLPEIVVLDPYLALNFEAKMQILSFELYSRIDNLNHSRYAPAVGYAPEGIRFSYGIIWTFLN